MACAGCGDPLFPKNVNWEAYGKHEADHSPEPGTWDGFFAVNVRAPMLVARAAVGDMQRRGWGRIINNTTSFRTMLRVLPYGATGDSISAESPRA